jgi:glycerol-3-phosphate acyltransferase PlsY
MPDAEKGTKAEDRIQGVVVLLAIPYWIVFGILWFLRPGWHRWMLLGTLGAAVLAVVVVLVLWLARRLLIRLGLRHDE